MSTYVRGASKAVNRFFVEVDYTKLFTDMVKAGGYDFVNGNIVAKNFPVEGTGLVESELIVDPFDWGGSLDDVIKKMDRMGLVLCKVEHLLALGARYPGLQKEYPIICLGSSWIDQIGCCGVPYLDWCNDGRELRLYWFDFVWRDDCRFAAVCK